MKLELFVTPFGQLRLEESNNGWEFSETISKILTKSFLAGNSSALLVLLRETLPAGVPDAFLYFRKLVKEFLTRLCHAPEPLNEQLENIFLSIRPELNYFESEALEAPPMRGVEYINADVLSRLWRQLEEAIQKEFVHFKGTFSECIRKFNPAWKQVGKVSFHLAENKQDTTGDFPFAFMATFIHRLSENDKPKHLPLASAIKAYANDKNALLKLLTPVQEAAQKSPLIKSLVDSGEIYHPIAWSARDAYTYLQDTAKMEEAGIIVRIANLWKNKSPSRVQVSVKLDVKKGQNIGIDAMLDFTPEICLDGVSLSKSEIKELLKSNGGIIRIKGEWVQAEPEKIKALLAEWDKVKKETGEMSFVNGMRLLAGVKMSDTTDSFSESYHEYNSVQAVGKLKELMENIDSPELIKIPKLSDFLSKTLRPYQLDGVKWLWRMTELGLGGCLADDMGLGKTLQVLSMLSLLKQRGDTQESPALLVVPASLLKNWEREALKFTPELRMGIFHSMAMSNQELAAFEKNTKKFLAKYDCIVTTYGMILRLEKLTNITWSALVVDEAQAIKNPQSKQSKAVRSLISSRKLALTGTPVENNLIDLWSIFDFISPGLLGKVKSFKSFINSHKDEDGNVNYAPLRRLTKPYIMRRLKTDKRIITDLPDKTDMKVYCQLTKTQAILYEQTVKQMEKEILQLKKSDGIQRHGMVFKYLMAFKQICNHPAHYDGRGDFNPDLAGKFLRLSEIIEEISSRQEKVLIFTQFKEMTEPLHDFLARCFGRPGLVLHGGTAIKKRQKLVEEFQSEFGPPYFVLSLKAAGTGLNLTAANHVVHFDRWWNPAVENQATDRAFRIGQHRNVLAHKFICKGTIEEKIDSLIDEKKELADSLLSEGAEKLLTNMSNEELLNFVALDITATLNS